MGATTLQIILHGLIALLPANGPDGANHMTALLMDAGQARPGVENSSYRPTLRITTTRTIECVTAGCKVSDGAMCTCVLSRQEISIHPNVEPAKLPLAQKPTNELPTDSLGAASFSYVRNLSQLASKLALDPKLLDSVPPNGLVARMSFPFESVTSSDLSSRRDEEGANIHPMSFRSLSAERETIQEPAQEIVAKLMIPEGDDVTLTISGFDGSNAHSLTLQRGTDGYRIELMNEPVPPPVPDDPSDDGIGRDFSFFYNLTRNPPTWTDRPIPPTFLP